MSWDITFMALFEKCLTKYKAGDKDFSGYYDEQEISFLQSIGYKPREFFDFVEDYADAGVPAPSTALLIAAVRRDYFMVVQKSQPSPYELDRKDLPSFNSELDGVIYLPRIIKKARGKLKGELDPDIMFSCGGDRKFLKRYAIHPADFLRKVWAAGDDDRKIVDFVKNHL